MLRSTELQIRDTIRNLPPALGIKPDGELYVEPGTGTLFLELLDGDQRCALRWATLNEATAIRSQSATILEEVSHPLVVFRDEFSSPNGDGTFYQLRDAVYAFPAFGWWLVLDYDRHQAKPQRSLPVAGGSNGESIADRVRRKIADGTLSLQPWVTKRR